MTVFQQTVDDSNHFILINVNKCTIQFRTINSTVRVGCSACLNCFVNCLSLSILHCSLRVQLKTSIVNFHFSIVCSIRTASIKGFSFIASIDNFQVMCVDFIDTFDWMNLENHDQFFVSLLTNTSNDSSVSVNVDSTVG